MKNFRKWGSWTFWIFWSWAGASSAANVTFSIDPTLNNNVISPYIYGSNDAIPGVTNTFYRSGGNRLSAYNWETNWSNAGSDYYYENDTLMGNKADGPDWANTSFEAQNKVKGADSLVTLQLAGYVSANGETPVQVPAADYMTAPSLTDPHGNFFPILFVKPGAPASYADPPNLNDGVVYIDEMVNYLVNHLGSSTNGGIKFYDLDNEPGAWQSTHIEVHDYPVSYVEVANKGITVATETKAIDPGAQTLGPVGYGWGDFINLSGAPDHATYDATYNNNDWVPFLNYYLAKMQAASNSAGHRLLDYLDSHVYSEGTDAGGNRVQGTDVSQDAATTRMQLPREMWDPTFTESNWISCCVPSYGPMTLIPRLQGAVSQYYPGTKIAFTEYDYGGEGDVSGGIAEADFLGTLGKYSGMLASIWTEGGNEQYLTCAFNFYLNYDGSGSSFGDTSVMASSSNVPLATVYAAKDSAHPNRLNVVLLNKDYSANDTANVTLSNLTGSISSIRAFRFDSAISVITASTAPTFTGNTFTDTLPFRSATLYELTLSQGFATSTPTKSATPTSTATNSSTATATSTGTLPTSTFTLTRTSTPTATGTPTVTLSPTPTVACTNLFNSCDSLTANGSWAGTNATRSISTTDVTQGTDSLQTVITTGSTWADQILDLSGFTPTSFSNVAKVELDINVPAGLLSGTSYNNLYLFADSPTNGFYEQQISSSGPSLVAGQNNNVTFILDWPTSGFTSSMPLTKLWFIFSNSGTNTGTLYVDNIRIVQSCAVTPTATSGSTSTSTYSSTTSPTRTATPSPSPTATSSATRTVTMTLTATLTNSPSNTATNTPSRTSTFSPTATSTGTSSFTPVNSVTPTPSSTSTLTRTSTASATTTATPSASPTVTATPSNSPTPTDTFPPGTFTPTPPLTSTQTFTLTHTATPTVTSIWTASLTPTASLTSSFTATKSSTPPPSSTPTFTLTNTATSTASKTASSTPTASFTPNFTSTNSPTPPLTATSTFTRTTTATPTVTKTVSSTPTPSFTTTPTLTAIWTSTASGQSGPVLYPNPVQGQGPVTLRFTLPSFAPQAQIKIYTVAFRLVQEIQLANVPAGADLVPLKLTDSSGGTLANGLYYVVLATPQGRFVTRLLILR